MPEAATISAVERCAGVIGKFCAEAVVANPPPTTIAASATIVRVVRPKAALEGAISFSSALDKVLAILSSSP